MITVERLTVSAGAEEPVTVADVMGYGRITDPLEVPMVTALITAAREELERLTGRIVLPGTFGIISDQWVSQFELPIAPITSIDSVAWEGIGPIGPDDVPALPVLAMPAIGPSIGDGADSHSDFFVRNLVAVRSLRTRRLAVGPLTGSALSAVPPGSALRIKVTAGYLTPDAVPAGIRQYVRTLAVMRYAHRDDPEAVARANAYAGSAVASFGVSLA